MTATIGTPLLWSLADTFGIVPQPPTERLARLLAAWWARPRAFGCAAAKRVGVEWFVVAPDSRIWCATCAADRFVAASQCVHCGANVPGDNGVSVVFAMRGVHVLGRSCLPCHGGDDQ